MSSKPQAKGREKTRGETMKNQKFTFKTKPSLFEKERDGIKPNTTREIDLEDERFLDLIYWMQKGWNDGDIQIEINKPDGLGMTNSSRSFTRNIIDISIYKNLMIISWKQEGAKK